MTWKLAVLWLVLQPAFDSPRAAFERAEALYQEERYQEAIETYETIRELPVEDAALYYNLGNAYFKAGRLGRAILNYERALRLAPGDEDARANLAFANELVAGSVESPPLPLAVGWAVDFYQRLGSSVLAAVLSVAFLFGGVGVSLLLIDRWPAARRAASILSLACAVLALASGAALLAKLHAEQSRVEAIVVTENAYVRSGPGISSPRLAEIHEGLKLRVLGERESFVQVALSNGLTGWIPREQIEVI